MGAVERGRRTGFSLRLEQGLGRLVLAERRIADLFTVEGLQLGLSELPSRLDMSGGVERFRHQRSRLERLVVTAEDHDLGRALRAATRHTPLTDLEVRALDGDLVVLGALAEEPAPPFIARARLEPAGVGDERALLISVYEVRVFGPSRWVAPQVAEALLRGLGLGDALTGPTTAVIDPVGTLLFEVCAELGWKLPDRAEVRLADVRSQAGRVRLEAERPQPGRVGPRTVGAAAEGTTRARRFLADYEAKALYQSIEELVAEGRLERAVAAYERQLEVHPEHPFLVTRLLQLVVGRPETRGIALALARARLARYPDDPDARCALGVVQWRRGELEAAAETWRRLAELAESRGDAVEAAQARCAVAGALQIRDPQAAISALEGALALRRRLPGALRALADLRARVGDWAASLRTRERLLAGEPDPEARRALLHQLGRCALDEADDVEAAVGYFERALEIAPDDVEALRGLAGAQERLGRLLPAVRTLDRAARLLQARGDAAAAADVMVHLGDLWRREPDGGATAALRYRQALLLAPQHAGALLGLAETAAASDDAARAREHYEELLRRTAEADIPGIDRAAVHLRLGHLLAGPLGDGQLAVSHFQKALGGKPAQVTEAIEALERLHADAGRWDDVARVLEMAVEHARSPAAQAAGLLRLAAVVRGRHGDPDRATRLLERAADLAPDGLAPLEALAEVHRAQQRWAALAEVLERLTSRVSMPGRLADLYAERGDLLRQRLNLTDEAVQAYTLALGCLPTHRRALEGLADLYRERERFGELAALLERLGAVIPAPDEAALVWLELGRLQATVLGRPQGAVTSLERALEGLPDDTEALRRLGDLRFDTGDHERALAAYGRLYALYEERGYDEPAPAFLQRLAETYDALHRADDALEVLRRALEEAPDDASVYEQAQDVLLRRGDVDGIVAFFDEGLARATRPSVRRFLARRAGRLLWRELRRPKDAAERLDLALRLDPDDPDVRRVRLEVATALADWPRVASLLRAQLERADAAERPALLTSLAKLAYNELDRPEEGTRLALAALDESPGYVPALALLGERAFAAGDWARAHRAYAALVDEEAARSRPDDRLRLGLSALEVGRPADARLTLEALIDEGHAAPAALEGLARALIDLGDAEALDALLQRYPGALGGEDDLEPLRAASRLLVRTPATRVRGLAGWSRVLAQVPDDPEAVAALGLDEAPPLASPAAELVAEHADAEAPAAPADGSDHEEAGRALVTPTASRDDDAPAPGDRAAPVPGDRAAPAPPRESVDLERAVAVEVDADAAAARARGGAAIGCTIRTARCRCSSRCSTTRRPSRRPGPRRSRRSRICTPCAAPGIPCWRSTIDGWRRAWARRARSSC